MHEDYQIGTRLREIRSWRRLSVRAVAELSGISFSYLAKIERGERPVNSRKTLEALCRTLRVSPAELTGKPWAPADPVSNEGHATLLGLEVALESFDLGVDPGVPARPWPEVAADVARLVDLIHVHTDYAGQGTLTPPLMAELHAIYVRDSERRKDALLGLIHCYSASCWVGKRLGGHGIPLLAARMAQHCAQELEMPEWSGYTAWLRADVAGQLNRAQQYTRTVRTADELVKFLDNPNVVQAYGMLHLSAAMAAAAQADRDTMSTHLDEASAIADRLDDEVGYFARMWFGRTNVGIWRTSLATELGEGPKVAELARTVHPEMIPSPSRQAEFWCDVGRSLLAESRTRERGLSTLLHAERLAPQRVRNDVFVREAIADLIRRNRREAGGRELRGLAWRMGVTPVG